MTNYEPTRQDSIELESPESIDDVDVLEVGDRVIVGDREKPLTVVATGGRTIEDAELGDVFQEYVKCKGDWSGAVEVVLANELDSWSLDPTGRIVDAGYGRPQNVVRTHVADSRDRAAEENGVSA